MQTASVIYETSTDLQYQTENPEIMPATVLVAGVYLIPGIGKVVVTAAGVVIVAGAVIAVGSWTYNAVVAYFKAHRKNKSKRNHDKHTKPRAGRPNEGKKLKPDWKPRNPKRRPK